jgi:hypothetical protein
LYSLKAVYLVAYFANAVLRNEKAKSHAMPFSE